MLVYMDALMQTEHRFTVTLAGETNTGEKDKVVLESGINGRGFPQSKSQSGFIGTADSQFINE